ncbi:MAG: PepSY-associated TM helix domain-containing protein [Bacteroidota bacterium]
MNLYTSEVLEIKDVTSDFFQTIFAINWSLFLKEDIGQTIVGFATLLFVIMLITSLVLWWPQNKKAFKVNTWFRWKSDTKWKRKNYDLHNIVGFYSMFLVIFIALKQD